MSRRDIFRQVSLDRLASPEQLDQLIKVVDARGWIALGAIALILLAAVGWGFAGSLSQGVHGLGILIRSGGVFEVIPVAGGRVTDIAVSVGDTVTEGQTVARMAQPQLSDRLQSAKAALAALREQHQQLVDHGQKDLALQTAFLARQQVTVEQAIASAERSLEWYRQKSGIQEKLVGEGLLTRQTLLNTRQQQDAAQERISEGRSQLAQLAAKEVELRNRRVEQLRQSQLTIEQQELVVAELAREHTAKTEIIAPHTGRILEIMVEQGGVVADGEPILTLDLAGRTVKDLEAVLYVPSVHGKQIRVGMPVFIAPSTVKQEEYGMMVAKVTYVSDFPSTSRGMMRVLKNDKLVASLAGQDAPYEVHADLVLDPNTPSRYRWTSSQGPPLKVQSGTVIVGNITVAARRPIELVIPLLRQHAGL